MKTENRNEENKKRNSVLLFIALIMFAIGAMAFGWGRMQEKGATAVVTVAGEERIRCSLFIEKEIRIDDTNTLVIKDGVADMVSADCPDQVCVKHTPISNAGETIICLPNKVVVTIEPLNGRGKSTRGGLDAVVK